MMPQRLIIVLLVLIVLAVLSGIYISEQTDTDLVAQDMAFDAVDEVPQPMLTEDLSHEWMPNYRSDASTQMKDLAEVRDLIEVYHSYLKDPDGLPTAGNRAIVKAFAGENVHRIRFIDPEADYINDNGELVDRWNSPLYFHFEDARFPDIRSAGPDRQIWTQDDIALTFR
ncbi:MAG: hypothetical protein AAF571_15060 [Verrucomicrobiota bacterium]